MLKYVVITAIELCNIGCLLLSCFHHGAVLFKGGRISVVCTQLVPYCGINQGCGIIMLIHTEYIYTLKQENAISLILIEQLTP